MAITNEIMRMAGVAGNGETTSFPYTFKIFDDDHLKVISKNDTTGVETVLTKTTHYSVTGVLNVSGGNVVMVSAPATGTTLHILLDPPFTQGADLNSDEYENIFDKVVQMNQRVKDLVSRSLRVSDASPVVSSDLQFLLTPDTILGINSSGALANLLLADIGAIASVTAPLTFSGNVLGIDLPLNNHTAVVAPTTNDDETEGYEVGSIWTDGSAKLSYVCVKADEGAAEWKLYTGVLAALNSVDTAQIADNAVTLAKLAHGTQGGVPFYGASGAPSELSAGTAGQVLTCAGAGANPAWATPLEPIWEHIGTVNFTTDTGSVAFTDLGDYRTLRLTGFMWPKNDSARMSLRTSDDNGVGYESGASNYEWNVAGGYSAGFIAYSDTADSVLSISGPIGNLANEEAHFQVILNEFNQSRRMWATGFCTQENASPTFMSFAVGGTDGTTAARDALLLMASSGDMAAGRFILEGIRG